MTRAKLRRIASQAMIEAVKAGEINPDRASDFGQLARYWERLADAADALDAVLTRQESYATVPPSEL